MELIKIVYRNLFFHKTRTLLTVVSATIAVFGFCMIRTLIDAWYSGVNESSKDRLITRNAVSLIFPLPYSYGSQISKLPGVLEVGFGNWFGGEFRDSQYQFGQFAVSDNYFSILQELSLDSEVKRVWLGDKKGILVGGDIARKFNLKTGDIIQIKGTIYPGLWEFKVSGVFTGRSGTGDERQVFFHWDYLNERNKLEINRSPDYVGFYSILLNSSDITSIVARQIDALFKNSYAETKTETESEFIRGFVSMSSAIVSAMDITSFAMLFIMLLIVTNTMLISFRERKRDYAIMKALGFGMVDMSFVILGESLLCCLFGLIVAGTLIISFFSLPREVLLGPLMDFVPVFMPSKATILYTSLSPVVIAILAGIPSIFVVFKERTVEGLKLNC